MTTILGFQSNLALKNHLASVHEKLKPYLCDICGYSASAKVFRFFVKFIFGIIEVIFFYL